MKTPAPDRTTTEYELSSEDVARLITFLGGVPGDAVRDPRPVVGGEVRVSRCRDTGRSEGKLTFGRITFICRVENEQCEVNCRRVSRTGPDGNTVFEELCDVVDREVEGSKTCAVIVTGL